MRNSLIFILFLTPFITPFLGYQAEASPAGPLIKHLSSFLKWTRSSPKTPQTDGNVLQFENGYLVETVVEGNELGVVPYSIRVSQDDLFAVDAVNSNIVRITPPLSQYSRARLVAGSFQGYTGHVDGKPSDARFNHPKGVTMDDKGNLYVADTSNLAIRKIGEAGVTTIAGGKSNVAGYRDGPSEDAKFSSDFDVVYVGRTCSLLVVDRGNAALRQIALNQEDCDYQHSSISSTDIVMVVGAVLVGYVSCMIQHGFGSSVFSRKPEVLRKKNHVNRMLKTIFSCFETPFGHQQAYESELQNQPTIEKPTLIVESLKEDQDAGWPSFGRLIIDLAKLAVEALGSVFLYFIPFNFRSGRSKKGLTPIRDSLVMPKDKDESPPPSLQKQRTATPTTEARHVPATNASDNFMQHKLQKSKSVALKDPSLSTKHRSAKRQDFAEFYGSGDLPPPYSQLGSKSQKERTRHRHRDRSGEVRSDRDRSGEVRSDRDRSEVRSDRDRSEVRSDRDRSGEVKSDRDRSGERVFGAAGMEPKSAEIKTGDYGNPKFDHYNFRNKYSSDNLFNF